VVSAAPRAAGAPALGDPLDAAFFARPVAEVAPDMVGCSLLVGGVGGVIVEVERYQQDDPASHSYRGPAGRAAVMFGEPGRLYVYRSYGLHWCLNVVCEP
jgi:DNA-3-methyladenine glycosylase